MKIYRQQIEVADVYAKDSSYTNEEINGMHTAYIEFDILNPVELTINDWIEYQGNKYYIRYQSSIEKAEDSRGYHYKVTLYHDLYRMHDIVLFMYDQPDFDKNHNRFIGTVSQVMALVVKSMNRVSSGWSLGTVIESDPFNFDLTDKTCADVVNDIINQFNTEYWVEGRVINIGKREYSQNDLYLSQGFGFKSVTLEAVDDTPPITRLWARGSDVNLYKKDYGSDYLLMPNKKLYVEKNVDKYGIIESIKAFDDIFPKSIFTVTNKLDDFTLQASGIDFNLKDQLLDGIEVIVTFQDGGLAGYDLAIVDDSWDNSTKQFKLSKNEEENALKVPGDINFSVGDKFFLTGLKMPQSYITAAEKKLEEAAKEWLDAKCENRIQLRCTCDEVTFAERDIFIACGQLVGVTVPKLGLERAIRCVAVKRYIEEDYDTPYRYEITLSDFVQGNGLSQIIEEIKDLPNQIEQAVNPVKQFTKRTWRDVMESMEQAFDPEGGYFTEIIKPLVVHTAQLIVGTNSQQMTFEGVYFIPNYNNNPNSFRNTAGYLHHFTINSDGTTRTWSISAGIFNFNSSYQYVYAKCPRNGTTGYILISTSKFLVESDSNYYHFLVGGLNTAQDGVRSWQPSFGYTEIAGNQITTGLIKDSLARMVIDLVNGTIYGKITFASGTTGYDNIADKPDLGLWSTAITNSVLSQSNANANNYVKTAQEDLAKNLGYTNYNALVVAATQGKTIIEGGYVRTSLIQAEAIIAKYVTAAYIAALEITTSKLTVTDGAKIGGFTIEKGWLTANATPSNDIGYIDMQGSNSRIAFGANFVAAGYTAGGTTIPCMALIANGKGSQISSQYMGLRARATGGQGERLPSIAVCSEGALHVAGGMGIIEEVHPPDVDPTKNTLRPAGFLRTFNTLVFQPTSSDVYFTLPSSTEISNEFGAFASGKNVSDRGFIRLKIMVTRYATKSLYVQRHASAAIIKNNGDETTSIALTKGRFLELGYFNQNWYTLSSNW